MAIGFQIGKLHLQPYQILKSLACLGLTNKYALWLNFRMIDENTLHGTGSRTENTLEGITLQIEKKAETLSAKLKAYIYLIMDAQLNINEGPFVSAIYKEEAGDKRTSYSTVCSSNKNKKNTPNLGFTRKGMLQSFPFHHYYLYHPVIQCYIQESKVALD